MIYDVRDLGSLGEPGYWGYAINAAGDVAGVSYSSAGLAHACLWQANGAIVDLSPALQYSIAYALNASDQVVIAYETSNPSNPSLWANGVLTLITQTGGPRGINDAGQIAGFTYAMPSGVRAFTWTPQAGLILLDQPFPGAECIALGINNSGQVVGSAQFGPGPDTRACLWSPGGQLQFMETASSSSSAAAINDAGQAVGVTAEGAFIWTQQSGLQPLAPASPGFVPTAISAAGDVVGSLPGQSSSQYPFGTRAAIVQAGVALDLNQMIPANYPGWLSIGMGINASGQIVCSGESNLGNAATLPFKAYRLTPPYVAPPPPPPLLNTCEQLQEQVNDLQRILNQRTRELSNLGRNPANDATVIQLEKNIAYYTKEMEALGCNIPLQPLREAH